MVMTAKNIIIIHKLGSIGDVNPIEHGGGLIFIAQGSGGPWVEYVDYTDDCDDEDNEERVVEVYRVDLGVDGHALMRDLDWADLDAVARSCGYTTEDPWKRLRTAKERAWLVLDVAGHYGWFKLDQYPLRMTVRELRERWGL